MTTGPREQVRLASKIDDMIFYDQSLYRTYAIRAAASVLSPFGSDSEEIGWYLSDRRFIPLAIPNRLGSHVEEENPVVELEFHRVCAIPLG